MKRLVLSSFGSSGAKNFRFSVERPVAPVSLTIIYPGWRFAYPRLFKSDTFSVSFPILLIVKVIMFESCPEGAEY